MRPTDNPATRIAWKIRDIEHRHLRLIQGLLERSGLHFGQPRILHTVQAMNGAPQKEIADQLHVSPASLAMSIKRMQKAGFLETVGDQTDMRVKQVRITAKGSQVLKGFHTEALASDQRMLQDFSPAELEQLESYLERIFQNLERIGEPEHAQ